MSVEITKDERIVEINSEGKYVMTLSQEQVYDKENVEAMLADWAKKIKEYEDWIASFDSHVEDGAKLLLQQLTLQKNKMEKEIAHMKEGIELWSNVRSKSD